MKIDSNESLSEILKKQQYQLKLGVVFFLCSFENILIFCLTYLIFQWETMFFVVYSFGALIAYWALFKKTKGEQYDIFIFKLWCKMNRLIRLRIKERKNNAFGF
ncbi:hypothetical protein CCZ01_09215 [Helicobacter monodelphidis]|uniref:hypothetical protein n=1 Tax=Helicobacter sp. 15-1451 TaxID=2004995 RepID=UPI000DCC4063|nr:hypothetical protein [Helicobacter sp. 15-1451]RAX56543.1 hypothetical protein CCZ01_09215 [Helicobacter sp. 15-1451]